MEIKKENETSSKNQFNKKGLNLQVLVSIIGYQLAAYIGRTIVQSRAEWLQSGLPETLEVRMQLGSLHSPDQYREPRLHRAKSTARLCWTTSILELASAAVTTSSCGFFGPPSAGPLSGEGYGVTRKRLYQSGVS